MNSNADASFCLKLDCLHLPIATNFSVYCQVFYTITHIQERARVRVIAVAYVRMCIRQVFFSLFSSFSLIWLVDITLCVSVVLSVHNIEAMTSVYVWCWHISISVVDVSTSVEEEREKEITSNSTNTWIIIDFNVYVVKRSYKMRL